MSRHWVIERLNQWGDQEAILWGEGSVNYRWLREEVDRWLEHLTREGVSAGQVVVLEGDYSPRVCGLLLALIENRNIVVPLTAAAATQRDRFLGIAQAQVSFRFGRGDAWTMERFPAPVSHPLLNALQREGAPGLILFSSGSTGEPKAALHRFDRLLEKFETPRQSLRTLSFLLLDHIGGINTLFYTLTNGGTVISIEARSPETVCRAIERYRIELLPTSPTFLNLLLISGEQQRHDLSSLRLVTYGTEPMPAATLARLNAVFPDVRFQQTYGLSELGILRSKSRDSDSLWVKIGGDGYETKVVDNILWIRSRYSMLGYLNAPSPFDAEGWFNTRDVVEVDGEYLRILGRETDIINVGGEKVYPTEVESVLLQMDNVRDVVVRGEANPILGRVVAACFSLFEPEDLDSLKKRVRQHCREKLRDDLWDRMEQAMYYVSADFGDAGSLNLDDDVLSNESDGAVNLGD